MWERKGSVARKILELRNVCKTYGDNVILDHFNLSINEDEFVTFLGPSGCGKTTTLRIIGGFETMQSGQLLLDGVEIQNLPSHKRPINTVFQKYSLFPHLNVYDNIAFGLRNNIYSNVYDIGMMNMMEEYGFSEEDIDSLAKKTSMIENPKDVKSFLNSFCEERSSLSALEKALKAKGKRNVSFGAVRCEMAELLKELGLNIPLSFSDDTPYKIACKALLAQTKEMDVYAKMKERLNKHSFKETVIKGEVLKALKLVNLEGYEDRDISSLSGGQQQRVAIARAIVNKPRILLLDEPLSALDQKLRKSMRLELKELQQKLGITFIVVTHDQEEAMVMSDTIVVMNGGEIQQMGRPEDIYNAPVNRFVASFIGEANILRGTFTGPREVTMLGKTFKVGSKDFKPEEKINVIVEKDAFDIGSPETSRVVGVVEKASFSSNKYTLSVRVGDAHVVVESEDKFSPGQNIGLSIAPGNIYCEPLSFSKAELLANYEGANILEGVYLGAQRVLFLGASFQTYLTTFLPGEVVDAVIRPEDFDLEFDHPEKTILRGTVIKSVFTGVHFSLWIKVGGTVLLVQDYQNCEVGDEVGLRVDFYEIHLMKVEDEAQPPEIQQIRHKARRLAKEAMEQHETL